ncbi:MAG: MATE family efflux transporter [Tannerella sp.]|jgi:putative MATE family efflux protein|nr:MATE family efflux transporter [Tannerella sp.]
MSNRITWRLENEKIGRLLLHYTIPSVIGTMINSLYNIVDRMYIGHGVGALAISGLALTFPIMMILQAFGMLVGVGASTHIAIFLGKKNVGMAEKILGNSFSLTLIITLLTVTPCMLFMDELLTAFGGNAEIIPYASDYLYIVIPANIFSSLNYGYSSIMRASGYPNKAMVAMIIGATLNIILDPIFIFWLDMGIRGAAIATAISMFISASFVMIHFVSRKSMIRFHWKYFLPDMKTVGLIVSIGLSPFAMQMAGSSVSIVMNHSLQTYGGSLALGANAIIISFSMFIIMFVVGIAQGMQPIIGFNYGAGHLHRVMETLWKVIITSTIIMSIGWICCLFFPEIIVKAFTSDPEQLAITSNGLKINMMLSFVIGSQITISHFFQSIGKAWKSIFLSLTRQIIFLVPAILILPPFFGLDGVWYAEPLSDLLAAATAWLFLWYHINRKQK